MLLRTTNFKPGVSGDPGRPLRRLQMNRGVTVVADASVAVHDPSRLTDGPPKSAAIILSLLIMTGILRRSGTKKLGAAEVLSTTFQR
jgi:hypothetical protein